MATIRKIKVNGATYDIAAQKITDSSATYTVTCPTLTGNTTIEVTENKTTTITRDSTNDQYPTAKAVYTAVKNAIPALDGTAVAADVRKNKTFYGASYTKQTGTMADTSVTLSGATLATVTVSPEATVSMNGGSVSLTTPADTVNYYPITATGGSSASTATITNTVTASYGTGYISGGTKTVTTKISGVANTSTATITKYIHKQGSINPIITPASISVAITPAVSASLSNNIAVGASVSSQPTTGYWVGVSGSVASDTLTTTGTIKVTATVPEGYTPTTATYSPSATQRATVTVNANTTTVYYPVTAAAITIPTTLTVSGSTNSSPSTSAVGHNVNLNSATTTKPADTVYYITSTASCSTKTIAVSGSATATWSEGYTSSGTQNITASGNATCKAATSTVYYTINKSDVTVPETVTATATTITPAINANAAGNIVLGTKTITQPSNYYIAVTASNNSSTVSISGATTVSWAEGYIKTAGSSTISVSGTATVNANTTTVYYPIGQAGISYAGGSVSITGGTITAASTPTAAATITTSPTASVNVSTVSLGTNGISSSTTKYYIEVNASANSGVVSASASSGEYSISPYTVTRSAVSDTRINGWLPSRLTTTVIAVSTVSSATPVTYSNISKATTTTAVSNSTSTKIYLKEGSASHSAAVSGAITTTPTVNITGSTTGLLSGSTTTRPTTGYYVIGNAGVAAKTYTIAGTCTLTVSPGYISAGSSTASTVTATVTVNNSNSSTVYYTIDSGTLNCTGSIATKTITAETPTATVSGSSSVIVSSATYTKPSGNYIAIRPSIDSFSTTVNGTATATVTKGYFNASTTSTPTFSGTVNINGISGSTAYYPISISGAITDNVVWNSNLTVSSSDGVPMVTTAGIAPTASYLSALTIPKTSLVSSITNNGGVVGTVSNSGSISGVINAANTTASLYGNIDGVTNQASCTIKSLFNNGTIGVAGSTTTGLYGAGIIYTRATGASLVSDAAASQFAIGEIINRGGSTEIGGYITKITNSGRAYIGTLNNTGTIKRLETSGYIEKFIQKSGEILDPEIGEANSIYTPAFGTATNPCLNSGSVYIAHNSSHLGSVTVRSKTSSLGWNVISNGVAKPFIEVSTASDLSKKLNANNLNLLFKYTGETTTYNGVTFTQNNIYTYTAT